MKVWPLRFRNIEGGLLFADDAGSYFRSSEAFLTRYAHGAITTADQDFLTRQGHAYLAEDDLSYLGYAYRWVARQSTPTRLSYLILVPTLRCNLTCSYCQVSRAPEHAQGFDWSEKTVEHVLSFLGGLDTEAIRIEFQGGEPLLRLDLLERVRDFCRQRFTSANFVVCTNLQNVSEAAWTFLDSDDTFISTSFDGDAATHERQRTQDPGLTGAFLANLAMAIHRFGPGRVSALPTIDMHQPPDFGALIDNFAGMGLHSIYLRPINHHGFARRKSDPAGDAALWNSLHRQFVEALIARNHRTGSVMEEFYFSQCLKRVLRPGVDNHVDLRNPSLFASDYLVVDYDGKLYPTDEARMLSRIGRIDLAVGTVAAGVDTGTVATLNEAAFNNFDPDCIHCAYQPFCGADLVDDISRFGRVDLPRPDTWFCQRQLGVFDHLFELLYRDDEATRYSLSQWAGIASWPAELAPRHA